jgi:hypothetical protein
VNGTGTAGSVQVPITAGYSDTLNTTAVGLTPATVVDAALKNPGGVSFPTTNPQVNDHVAKFTVNVPAGVKYAWFSTFDADYPAGTDLDVFVYKSGTTTLLASSTGGSAEEEANLPAPAGGSYDVYVDLFVTPLETRIPRKRCTRVQDSLSRTQSRWIGRVLALPVADGR